MEWEQVAGVISAIEPTPMGLLITVYPVAGTISFYIRENGTSACPSAGIVEGALVEALMTPAGVRVRRVHRIPRRAPNRRP